MKIMVEVGVAEIVPAVTVKVTGKVAVVAFGAVTVTVPLYLPGVRLLLFTVTVMLLGVVPVAGETESQFTVPLLTDATAV